MSYLFILLSILFVTQTSDPEPKKLSISASGEVELKADQVQFDITVNAEADKPQAAYKLHKEREAALVDLLEKYNIKEENLRYAPISIKKSYERKNGNERVVHYQTRQQVRLTLDDFEVYEKIQVGLIENGYDNFGGQFTSSDVKEGLDKALANAIQEAKQKARLIAEEAGFELGEVIQVNYSFNQPRPAYRADSVQAQSTSGSLTRYEQSVTVSASISMQFAIK